MPSETIFSPTLANYEPAFLYTDKAVNIYFEPSIFNKIPVVEGKVNVEDMNAHISIHLQPSGINALRFYDDSEKIPKPQPHYPYDRNRQAEIIVNAPILISPEGKFYVEILNSEMNGNSSKTEEGSGIACGFIPGQSYKVQIRLSDKYYNGVDPEGENQYLSDWLIENADHFSEWSRVCIIKSIGEPGATLVLPKLNPITPVVPTDPTFQLGTRTLRVEYIYQPGVIDKDLNKKDLSEYLYKYKFYLYKWDYTKPDKDIWHLFEESDYLFANQSGQINNTMSYIFKQDLPPKTTSDGSGVLNRYKYKLVFQTNNEYEKTIESEIFSVKPEVDSKYGFHLVVVTNQTMPQIKENHNYHPQGHNVFEDLVMFEQENEDGYVNLSVFFNSEDVNPPRGLKGVFRRTSYKTGFREWEDLYFFNFPNEDYDPNNEDKKNNIVRFKDFTLESGSIYQYSVQVIEKDGYRDTAHISYNTTRYFEHMYLLGADGRQLKIKFNPKISSYKYNISESKTETIGSKYPYITRNAAVRYRTIPIEGWISIEMDDCKYFTTLKELYGFRNNDVEDEKVVEWIKQYGDNYAIEREFREKVLDFLLDGKPKLFKSPTEGNVLVRIMDVNSAPNQQLSRKIYSFTANMHEIGEYNHNNLVKYNFIKEEA